jgi:hypothetical protein
LLSFVLSLLSSLELERLSDIFVAFYTSFVVLGLALSGLPRLEAMHRAGRQ